MVTVKKIGQQAREVQRSQRVISTQQENNEIDKLRNEGYTIEQVNGRTVAYKEAEYVRRKDYRKDSDPSTWKVDKQTYRQEEIVLDSQGNRISYTRRGTYRTKQDKSGDQRSLERGVYVKQKTDYVDGQRASQVRYREDKGRIEVKKRESFDVDTGQRTEKEMFERGSERKDRLEREVQVVGATEKNGSFIDTQSGYRLTSREVEQRKQAYRDAVKQRKDRVEFETPAISSAQYAVPTDYMNTAQIKERYSGIDLDNPEAMKQELLKGSANLRAQEAQLDTEVEGTKERKRIAEQKFQNYRLSSGDYFGNIDTEYRVNVLKAEQEAYQTAMQKGNLFEKAFLKIKGEPSKLRKPTSVELTIAGTEAVFQSSIDKYRDKLQQRVDKGTMTQAQAQRLLEKARDKTQSQIDEKWEGAQSAIREERESVEFQDAETRESGSFLDRAQMGISTASVGGVSLRSVGSSVSGFFDKVGDKQVKQETERQQQKSQSLGQTYRELGFERVGSVLETGETTTDKLRSDYAYTPYLISGGTDFVSRKPLTAGAIFGVSAVSGGLVGAGVSTGGAVAVGTVATAGLVGGYLTYNYAGQVRRNLQIREGKSQAKYIGQELTKLGIGFAGFRTGYAYTTTPKVVSPIKYTYKETKVISGSGVRKDIPLQSQRTGVLEMKYTQKIPFKSARQVRIVQSPDKLTRTITGGKYREVFTQSGSRAQLKLFKGRSLIKTKDANPIQLSSGDFRTQTMYKQDTFKPDKSFSLNNREMLRQYVGQDQLIRVQGKKYSGLLKRKVEIVKLDSVIGKGTKVSDITSFKRTSKGFETFTTRTGKEQFNIRLVSGREQTLPSGLQTKFQTRTLFRDGATTSGTKRITPEIQSQIVQIDTVKGTLYPRARNLRTFIRDEKGFITPGKSRTETFTGIQTDYTGGSGARISPRAFAQSPTVKAIQSQVLTVSKPVITTRSVPLVSLQNVLGLTTRPAVSSLITSSTITGALLTSDVRTVTTPLTTGQVVSPSQSIQSTQVTPQIQTTSTSSPITAISSSTVSTTRTSGITVPRPPIPPPVEPPIEPPIIPPPIFPGFLPLFGFGVAGTSDTKRRKKREGFQRSFTARSLGIRTRKQAQSFFGKNILVEEKGKTKKGKFSLLGLRL